MRKIIFVIITTIFFVVIGCSVKGGTIYMVAKGDSSYNASFNEKARSGLGIYENLYKGEGWKADYKLVRSERSYKSSLQSAVDSGARLIWSMDNTMSEYVNEFARKNTYQNFVVIDWNPSIADEYLKNVSYVTFKVNEGSFLVGIIAGLTTESGIIGFVGGEENDLTGQYEAGFRAGISYVNSDAEVLVDYIQSFSNIDKAYKQASLMVSQGADVIYHAAGRAGEGVAEACKEKDVWFIGNEQDQSRFAPDNTLTSMIKRVDRVVYDVNESFIMGGFYGGEIISLGVADGWLDFDRTALMSVDAIYQANDAKELFYNAEIIISENPHDLILFEIIEHADDCPHCNG